jgi:putative DNA methylase
MRDQALERIGKLYPKVKLPADRGGGEATVIAWLWARTVLCPNPACGARMPLIRSFALSTKAGKRAWVRPTVDHAARTVKFDVVIGDDTPPEGTKQPRRSRCLFCSGTMTDAQLRGQAREHGLSAVAFAVVIEHVEGRAYLSTEPGISQDIVQSVAPWLDQPLPVNARWFSPPGYGLKTYRDLFTPRQLVALTTYSGLVNEASEQAIGDGATQEYASAIATYLTFAVDKMCDTNTTLCTWQVDPPRLRATFGRQALPMSWDFTEANIFADAAGDFQRCVGSLTEVLDALPARNRGTVSQIDATAIVGPSRPAMFSTDPPYYDNIGYADLSDFFYVWMRRNLGAIYPEIFGTLLVPKKQELIADPYRFEGNRAAAQAFFEEGFGKAFNRIRAAQNSDFPLTVYYAFKQSETDSGTEENSVAGQASTGWETMLEGLLLAGFQVTGTWPMRSELSTRNVGRGTNALASSIVLACRPRGDSAPITTRKELLALLKKELPRALRNLQKGNIAPVDLAQAAIGPGMAVFSRYKKVLETDGSPMRVRTALALTNQGLDEVLSELESEFDPDTRWALAWFEQHQFDEGIYGEAEVLATAKALSISHLAEAGILNSRAGRVRLLRREELPQDWDPSATARLTVWEVTQHLIRSLDQKGEEETANLKAKIGGMAEIARDLAYRLYTLCERKGWAEEAGYYNSLVVAWPSMTSEAFELT